jgi:integrase/recombinase XerC
LAAVTDWWRREVFGSEQSLARTAETATRYARRLTVLGHTSFATATAQDVADFVHAPTGDGVDPEIATLHARRSAVRALYRALRALGHDVGDPTLDLVLPARGGRTCRPLTDDEVMLARASSRLGQAGARSLRRAAAWALGESGAMSSEISALRVADLDRPHRPSTVALPGTHRADPRTVPPSDWAQRILPRWTTSLPDTRADLLLVYDGAAVPGRAVAQAAVCNALRDVLALAGLGREPGVRPGSLRGWVGRTAYEQGASVPQVAVLLGLRSLDAAADTIALDWRAGGGRS